MSEGSSRSVRSTLQRGHPKSNTFDAVPTSERYCKGDKKDIKHCYSLKGPCPTCVVSEGGRPAAQREAADFW